jgi:hypothetical protein
MDDTNTVRIIHRFGLESVISFEDDPLLWASVLKKHWIYRRGFSNQDLYLYFDVAVADVESTVGLRVIENWRFERRMGGRFKPVRWNEQAPAPISPKGLPFEMPYWHIAIERPSKDKNSVSVYEAVILADQYGFAETRIWRWYKPWILKTLWSGVWRRTLRTKYRWRM